MLIRLPTGDLVDPGRVSALVLESRDDLGGEYYDLVMVVAGARIKLLSGMASGVCGETKRGCEEAIAEALGAKG